MTDIRLKECEVNFAGSRPTSQDSVSILRTGNGYKAGIQKFEDETLERMLTSLAYQGVTTAKVNNSSHFGHIAPLRATELHDAITEVCALLRGFHIEEITYIFKRGDGEEFMVIEYYPPDGTLVLTNEDCSSNSAHADAAAAALSEVPSCTYAKWRPGSDSFDVTLAVTPAEGHHDQLLALVRAFPASPAESA